MAKVRDHIAVAAALVLLTCGATLVGCDSPLPSGPSPKEILREEIELWEETRLAEATQGWSMRPEARPIAVQDVRCRPRETPEEAICFYKRIEAGERSMQIEGRRFVRSGNTWEMTPRGSDPSET